MFLTQYCFCLAKKGMYSVCSCSKAFSRQCKVCQVQPWRLQGRQILDYWFWSTGPGWESATFEICLESFSHPHFLVRSTCHVCIKESCIQKSGPVDSIDSSLVHAAKKRLPLLSALPCLWAHESAFPLSQIDGGHTRPGRPPACILSLYTNKQDSQNKQINT